MDLATGVLVRDPAGATQSARYRPAFYFVMALLMAAVVLYGFSQTIAEDLIHPAIARPLLLYVHAAVFSAWLTLYILQTGLASSGKLRMHRRLGKLWLWIGAAVPVVGVATAIVMRRFDIVHFQDTLPFLSVPLCDMAIFTTLFTLGALWRGRPELHPGLMFLATCTLMDAAFSRFPLPDAWFDAGFFYAAVDALVLVAIARDLLVLRRITRPFAVGLPLMIVGQLIAWSLWQHPPNAWMRFCRAVVGVG